MKPPEQSRLLLPPPTRKGQKLPAPVFPQHPELMSAPDGDFFPTNGKRSHKAKHIYRAMRGWVFPFIRSRILPGDFHPIIAYLFNEWKCNLDCHYCWAFDNSVRGMANKPRFARSRSAHPEVRLPNPPRLWKAAVKLARRTAQILRVGYGKLKRMAEWHHCISNPLTSPAL